MDQADIVAFLERPEAHGGAGPVERIDTHISHVFLAGDHVWKLKRAVKLPYLDFSTPEKRREACESELAINRRTAPDLYRAVVPILRRADGALAVGADAKGAGTPVDWVVVMRRFDQSFLFDKMAERGALSEATVIAAVQAIAAFHAKAERADGGAETLARIIAGNRASVARAAVPRPLDAARAEALHAASEACLERLRAVLDRRGAAGLVRDGHGDLHLRNICLIDGQPVLFDAIEFNPRFRRIDVFYDFAFLLMALLHRGLSAHAALALEAYVAATGDVAGLETLPLFLAVRAIIRGHIEATQAQGEKGTAAHWAESADYFRLAETALAPPKPVLLAAGGLSGSGKSTVAKAIAPRLGALPGALLLRSDVVRKRLAGVAPDERLPENCYTPEWTARVYAKLLQDAGAALAAGHAVIADAVSGDTAQRGALEDVARRRGVPFIGLWLEAPLPVRVARVGARTGDASDAGVSVARQQKEPHDAELRWRRIDAGGSLSETIARVETAMAAAGTPLRGA